jgi:hypothetical protein
MDDWSALIVGGVVAGLVFVAAAVLGFVLAAFVLLKIPADYFSHDRARGFWVDKHPFVRLAGRVLKNILAAGLIVIGGALSLPGIPGPGLLIVLFGLTLLDFPGKRRFERWLVGRPTVLRTINRLRQRYGKPPIVLDSASQL